MKLTAPQPEPSTTTLQAGAVAQGKLGCRCTGASLEQRQRRRAAAAAHRVFLVMGSTGAAGGAATVTLPLAPAALPLLSRKGAGAARHTGRAARSGAARRSSGGGGTAATAGGWARHGLAAAGTVKRALARMLRRLASLADAEHALLRLGSRERTGGLDCGQRRLVARDHEAGKGAVNCRRESGTHTGRYCSRRRSTPSGHGLLRHSPQPQQAIAAASLLGAVMRGLGEEAASLQLLSWVVGWHRFGRRDRAEWHRRAAAV